MKNLCIFTVCVLSYLTLSSVSYAAEITNKTARIVSVSGGITEIIYELGAGDALVGVDTTSEYPKATQNVEKIGYMRALSLEGIASLKPDFVFLTKEAGPPHVREQLKQLNINVVELNSESSVEGLLERINTLAILLNKKKEGEILKTKIQKEHKQLIKQVIAETKINKEPKKVLFILSHGGNSLSIAGAGTAADSVLVLAGLKNVADDFQGYRMLGKEGLLQLQPDVIVTSEQGVEAWGGLDQLIKQNGIDLTEAGKQGKVIALDAMYLLGFGPRIVLAAQELHQSVYAK